MNNGIVLECQYEQKVTDNDLYTCTHTQHSITYVTYSMNQIPSGRQNTW